ncbi:MAG: glutamine--fructose-6-phosphate transaminase (isomerizing) [Clostridia bacterium]|nr:glutamine--fructose-6-phosphate transaminase (isomerizing) [Clostridia bacterium]
MCGIIGYTGQKCAIPILLEGLATLEYRGYDSAGIAVQKNGLQTVKAKGRLALLEEKLSACAYLADATCGIGHTRWATHGEPSDVNSHPHGTERLALVHNGIIENYMEIAAFLAEQGYTFLSQTDTEIAAKLIDYHYVKTGNPQKAIFSALEMLRGAYAFGICFADYPNRIYAVRRDNPLIVAVTEDGGLIASDVPAVLAHTNTYWRPEEKILTVIDGAEITFYNSTGEMVTQASETVDWNVQQARKGGFPHFMLKEIHEQPAAVSHTVSAYLRDGLPYFNLEALDSEFLKKFNAIHVVACGTAMHAGLIGKNIIERICRVPVHVEIASEFRYRDPILDKNDLVILLSQSGETADTLAALRHAKEKGVYTLAIVNVIGSTVAREADSVLYTLAGPEIAVASTKAYSVQCALLYLLALRLALVHKKISAKEARQICQKLLSAVPKAIEQALALKNEISAYAKTLVDAEHLFYIGRGIDCDLCTEASLKLKEISYIHSEAYAAGELKHGTISLVVENTPIIALCTVSSLAEKMLSGIREVASRGAKLLVVTSKAVADAYDFPADIHIVLPEIDELFAPFPACCVMQLLAYYVSAQKGLDVDKPRNLAKSVTVE